LAYRGKRITVSEWLQQKCKTLSKIQQKAKSTGGMAQGVGHRHKAMSLIPSITKKEREQFYFSDVTQRRDNRSEK
jgi:hypothetical protein